MTRSLVSSFLNGIADVLEVLLIERGEGRVFLDNRAILISFLALTVAVSFSRTMHAPLIALSVGLLIAWALKVKIRSLLKVMVAMTGFVIAITLPMALYQAYLTYAVRMDFITVITTTIASNVIPLLLRSVAAITIVTLMVQSLGLTGLIKGLKGLRFPSSLLFVIMVYMRYIPLMLRQAAKIISAREARLVSKVNRVKSSWLILSTVIGSLFTRGFDRAYRLQMTFKARGLDFELIPGPTNRMSLLDFTLIALSLILACALVLM